MGTAMNKNGQQLCEFTAENNHWITNTFIRHKNIYQYMGQLALPQWSIKFWLTRKLGHWCTIPGHLEVQMCPLTSYWLPDTQRVDSYFQNDFIKGGKWNI